MYAIFSTLHFVCVGRLCFLIQFLTKIVYNILHLNLEFTIIFVLCSIDAESLVVKISGVDCNVTRVTHTEVECITGPSWNSAKATVEVEVNPFGKTIEVSFIIIVFKYLFCEGVGRAMTSLGMSTFIASLNLLL